MESSTASSRLHPQSLHHFKKLLPKDLVVSVQVKPESVSGCPGSGIEDNHFDNCRRVFFRIAMAQRHGAAAAEGLIGARPCFLAYYPGEPYFYCDSRNPAHTIVEARWLVNTARRSPKTSKKLMFQALLKFLSANSCVAILHESFTNLERLRRDVRQLGSGERPFRDRLQFEHDQQGGVSSPPQLPEPGPADEHIRGIIDWHDCLGEVNATDIVRRTDIFGTLNPGWQFNCIFAPPNVLPRGKAKGTLQDNLKRIPIHSTNLDLCELHVSEASAVMKFWAFPLAYLSAVHWVAQKRNCNTTQANTGITRRPIAARMERLMTTIWPNWRPKRQHPKGRLPNRLR